MNTNIPDPAGDLLLKEVDDDLRREQYFRLWRRYGKFAIAAAVAVVLAVAGHQIWLNWRDRQFQSQAATYAEAQALIKAGNQTAALSKLSEIADGNFGGFSWVAGFERAQMRLDAGDQAGALASYDALAHSAAPAELRDLASLKAAMLTVEKDDPETLAKTLQPLTDAKNPWRFTATELLAVLAGRRGDIAAERSYYQKLSDDLAAPPTIRARASEMLAVLNGPGAAASKPQKG